MFPFITSFLRVWTLISSLMFQKHYVVFSRSSANPCSWPVRSAEQRGVRIQTFSWNDDISSESFHVIPSSLLLFRILAPLRAIWPVRSLQHREGGGERREALWHTSTVWHTTLLVEHSTCVKQCLRHMVLAEYHKIYGTQQHCVAQHNSAWGTQCSCQCGTQCLPPSSNCPLKVTQRMNTPVFSDNLRRLEDFDEKLRNDWKLYETIFFKFSYLRPTISFGDP